jgi:ABC-type sugar transport system substrate-binding protein
MSTAHFTGRRKRLRALAAISASVVTASLLAACGGSADSSSSDAKKIGILVLVQSDEADQRILGAIDKQIKDAHPDWDTSTIDAAYDPSKELAGMDTFINQGVDGIITVFADNELLKTKISLASKRDIPVISLAGGPAVDGVVANLDTPEEDAGAALAQEVVGEMTAAGKTEMVKMVLPEAVPCKRRVAGMDTVLDQHPEIQQIEYHIDGNNAVPAAKDYLASRLGSDKNLGGILSCWDVPLMGALSAVKAAGIDGKTFVGAGINGTSNAVQAMQNGDPLVDALIAFGWADAGYTAVEQMSGIFDGDDVPAETEVKWAVLTPKNVPEAPLLEPAEWLPKGWDANYWSAS